MSTLYYSSKAQALTAKYLQAYRRANLTKVPGDFEAISQLSITAVALCNEILTGNAAQTGIDELLIEILAFRDAMGQAAPQADQPPQQH